MEPIRVVRGSGTGPTPVAAYDAALARANVENYNLSVVSSVIPAGATVEAVESAPDDLGAVGDRVTVVQARATGSDSAAAALAWGQTPEGPGLFYEGTATGTGASDRAREEAHEGLLAGAERRGWDLDPTVNVASRTAADAPHVCAVVVATYGGGEPLV